MFLKRSNQHKSALYRLLSREKINVRTCGRNHHKNFGFQFYLKLQTYKSWKYFLFENGFSLRRSSTNAIWFTVLKRNSDALWSMNNAFTSWRLQQSILWWFSRNARPASSLELLVVQSQGKLQKRKHWSQDNCNNITSIFFSFCESFLHSCNNTLSAILRRHLKAFSGPKQSKEFT